MPIVLCLLIGLPGAGKTTLSKLLKFECQKLKSIQVVHICFDELFDEKEQMRLVTKGNANSDDISFRDLRNQYFEIVKNVLINMDGDLHSSIKSKFLEGVDYSKASSNFVILLDDNFYYRSMRYMYYKLACHFSTGFCQIYLDCDKNMAEENNRSRSVQVAENVISVMCDRLEAPTKCSWEKQSLVLQTFHKNFYFYVSKIIDLWNNGFENPLSLPKDRSGEVKSSQIQCFQNFQHRADLMLRILVAEEIKSCKLLNKDRSYLKKNSLLFNQTRQIVLDKLKKGFPVPDGVVINGNINEEMLKIFLKNEFIQTKDQLSN